MNITTKIEKHFKKRPDGLFQEVFYHLVVYRNPDGLGEGKTVTDKIIMGKIFREATIYEHSLNGEAEFVDQNGIKHRLVALLTAQPV